MAIFGRAAHGDARAVVKRGIYCQHVRPYVRPSARPSVTFVSRESSMVQDINYQSRPRLLFTPYDREMFVVSLGQISPSRHYRFTKCVEIGTPVDSEN